MKQLRGSKKISTLIFSGFFLSHIHMTKNKSTLAKVASRIACGTSNSNLEIYQVTIVCLSSIKGIASTFIANCCYLLKHHIKVETM
jgi:hypothetical protein